MLLTYLSILRKKHYSGVEGGDLIKLITFSSVIILFNLILYTQISRKVAENAIKTSKTPKFTTNGVACDQKSYCFTFVVEIIGEFL